MRMDGAVAQQVRSVHAGAWQTLSPGEGARPSFVAGAVMAVRAARDVITIDIAIKYTIRHQQNALKKFFLSVPPAPITVPCCRT